MDNNKITTKSIGGSGFNNVTFKDGKATVYLGWKDEYKKEFCNYVLTIDIDIPFATPIKILEWLEPTIESLLKKQRENCMLEFQAGYKKRLGYSSISINIDHAPEPEGGSE